MSRNAPKSAGGGSPASFRGMSATDSEEARKSGRLPVGISGCVPSERVADLRRNQWPAWLGIRNHRKKLAAPKAKRAAAQCGWRCALG